MALTTALLKKCQNQILATLIMNILSISHGIALGWLAPTLPYLQSEDTHLSTGIITYAQASWVGSMLALGGIAGNIFYGLIIDLIGRRRTLFVLAVPHVSFWITVRFATHIYHLYVARFLAGFSGGGIFVTVPIIVAEISHNEIRGSLCAIFTLLMNVGILLGFILTSYLPYHLVPIVAIVLPLTFLLSVTFCMPETPIYLLKNRQFENAKHSYEFYENARSNTKIELQIFDASFSELEKTVAESMGKSSKVKLKDLVRPEPLRGLFVGTLLLALGHLSLFFAVLNYAALILKESGSKFDVYLGTILIGIMQIMGTLFSFVIVDYSGRKILVIISALGAAVGLATMGTFCHFSTSIDIVKWGWIPVASLCFLILVAWVGLAPLVYVIIAELVPHKVRAPITTILMVVQSAAAFVMVKIFPALMETLPLSVVMWIFSGITLAGVLLIFIFVPETKGKVLH